MLLLNKIMRLNKRLKKLLLYPVLTWFMHYLRILYRQIFVITCTRCKNCFYFVYFGLNNLICVHCSQEFCKYCLEIREPNAINTDDNLMFTNYGHKDPKRCFFRYSLIYNMGMVAFLILYLKIIFVCNSNFLTKYLTVTFFIVEYSIFSDKIENNLNNFISIKNIILGIILLIYYDEKDILIYLVVGMIQLMFILLINMLKDVLSWKNIKDVTKNLPTNIKNILLKL